MFGWLFLLFTVVPTLELYLIIQIGKVIGSWETVGMLLLSGTLGAWLAKREGFGILRQLQAEASQGIPPGDRLVEGLLILVGSALLVTPGVLTDVVGLLLIVPPVRRFLAPRVKTWALQKLLKEADLKVRAGTARPREHLRRPPEAPAASPPGFSHPRPPEAED